MLGFWQIDYLERRQIEGLVPGFLHTQLARAQPPGSKSTEGAHQGQMGSDVRIAGSDRIHRILAPAESEGSDGSGSNSDGSGRIRLFQRLWKEDPMDPVARIRSSKILRTSLQGVDVTTPVDE